jgi:hypothetical protein
MKAIEIITKTDNAGHLKVGIPLKEKNRDVRVLILFNEDEIENEKLWLYSNSKNPSFDFLNEPEENIYSLRNGEAIADDKK